MKVKKNFITNVRNLQILIQKRKAYFSLSTIDDVKQSNKWNFYRRVLYVQQC